MQIVCIADNLHDLTKPVFWKKKKKRNILNLLSTELAQRLIKELRLKIITSLSSFTILVTLQVDDDDDNDDDDDDDDNDDVVDDDDDDDVAF